MLQKNRLNKWPDFITMHINTNITHELDGNWEAQLLAKAASAEVEGEGRRK